MMAAELMRIGSAVVSKDDAVTPAPLANRNSATAAYSLDNKAGICSGCGGECGVDIACFK